MQNMETEQIARTEESPLSGVECLSRISAELDSGRERESVMRSIALHLRRGMRETPPAAALVRLYREEYLSSPFPRRKMHDPVGADIFLGGAKVGEVVAGHLSRAEPDAEERTLVAEAARMISRALERHELQSELERYIGNLEQLVMEKRKEVDDSRRHYEDYFQYAPDAMVISRPNGDIVKANRAFYRMLGFPEDGSVQLNYVRDHLYEDLPSIRPTVFQRLYEDGSIDSLELLLIDRERNCIPVMASYTFIDIDGERFVEEVYKDIHSRKEMENRLIAQKENLELLVRKRTEDLENQRNLLIAKNRELTSLTGQLHESRVKLQTLFHAITDTVIMIDGAFTIQMSNKEGMREGEKCHAAVFGQEQACANCPVVTLLAEGRTVTAEHKVGDEYYLLQAYPIFDDARRVQGAIEFSRRITKEKNLEYQLQQTDKMASLGQLVSGVAHEINNPNTIIRGNIAIIREAFADILPMLEERRAADPSLKIARLPYDLFREHIPVLVEDMVQGANRIKSIVDGLREYAKKDDGLAADPVDCNEVVERCLRLVQNQIQRTARIDVDLAPGLPPVRGNMQKLEQVLINIIMNASQAIDKEKGTIGVCTSLDAERGEVAIRVSDNGTGMEEKTMKQIFDPFFTTKRTKGGTGLGLAIAFRIIREHKGRIEVESTPGEGTTFLIHLPCA